MSNAISRVLVVIPARDEEELLPRCLDALASAVAVLVAAHPEIEIHTLVVADRTTDGTRGVVTRSPSVGLLAVEHGNVGAARRAGVSHLLRRGGDATATWIATTDADSIVPHDWLAAQIELAESGADVVTGGVIPEPEGLSPEQLRAWEEFHRLPDPTGDIHGANLGIRASAYLELGGFESRVVGEDVDLVRRATDAGYLTARATGMPVITSSRPDGRAPNGYSSWLHRGGLLPLSSLTVVRGSGESESIVDTVDL